MITVPFIIMHLCALFTSIFKLPTYIPQQFEYLPMLLVLGFCPPKIHLHNVIISIFGYIGKFVHINS